MSETKNPDQSQLDPKLESMLEIQTPKDKSFIYCKACSNVVTTPSERIMINASHDHYCTNPHGFAFHLGCFAQALGCDISGQGEAADSWFMGYVWQLATCSQCQTHLGWYFTSSQNSSTNYFYGLILDNIQEA